MCEILLVVWSEPQPFERILPWGLELERLGVGGFGWGVAWRDGDEVRRYRNPVRLSDDPTGRADLISTRSTHFLLHLRRPSQLSTVALADTQPFLSDGGSFAFVHNGRLSGAAEFRDRFPGKLSGHADSEVGFRLFEQLLEEGVAPAEALSDVHRQMGGNANLAVLPARGEALFYAGHKDNDGWRFELDGAAVASTALHSADEAVFSLCFPMASRRTRLALGEVAALGPRPATRPTAPGVAAHGS